PTTEVASVEISPDPAVLRVDATLQLEVAVLDHSDSPVTNRTLFWSSENSSIATVTPEGTVTGHTPGSVRVAASLDGISALATVIVEAPVATIAISPAALSLRVGEAVSLAA